MRAYCCMGNRTCTKLKRTGHGMKIKTEFCGSLTIDMKKDRLTQIFRIFTYQILNLCKAQSLLSYSAWCPKKYEKVSKDITLL